MTNPEETSTITKTARPQQSEADSTDQQEAAEILNSNGESAQRFYIPRAFVLVAYAAVGWALILILIFGLAEFFR